MKASYVCKVTYKKHFISGLMKDIVLEAEVGFFDETHAEEFVTREGEVVATLEGNQYRLSEMIIIPM